MKMDWVIRKYAGNLRKMSATLAKHSKGPHPVWILCVPPSNRAYHHPLYSAFSPDLSASLREEWKKAYADGERFEASGDLKKALDAYRLAASIDPAVAVLHYRMGWVLMNLDEWDALQQQVGNDLKAGYEADREDPEEASDATSWAEVPALTDDHDIRG